MEAIASRQRVFLTLPMADMTLLRGLSKKMGWEVRKERKSGIEKGLEDIRVGRIYHAKDSADLVRQILG